MCWIFRYCKRTSLQSNGLAIPITKRKRWWLSVITCNLCVKRILAWSTTGITQDFLINKVPVDGFPDVSPVLVTPLLILFSALWLHESDTGLSAPTVSQLAVCLVSFFSILESANTVGTLVVYIHVTNTVVNTINAIGVLVMVLRIIRSICQYIGLE